MRRFNLATKIGLGFGLIVFIAGSEEAASASEQLNAQAEIMREVVGDLVVLVEGAGKAERTGTPRSRGPNPPGLLVLSEV